MPESIKPERNKDLIQKLTARNKKLMARNKKLKAHRDSLEHELHSIKNSRSWRLFNLYRRLRTKLASVGVGSDGREHDLVRHDPREEAKVRLEGRDYVVEDDDVMLVRFNVQGLAPVHPPQETSPERATAPTPSSAPEPPGDPDYTARIAAEQKIFAEREVLHSLPQIYHYWSHNHLRPVMKSLGFGTPKELFAQTFERAYRARAHGGPARFASVGAGNCDTEVQLARDLLARGCEDFVIECLDLNPAMLERGEGHAREADVEGYVKGLEVDFNRWEPEGRYDGVLAQQVLHHVVNLEGLYDTIHRALTPKGLFVTSDMIGRNGHQRWPEARRIVERFWEDLPRSYRFHNALRRQEDEFLDWDWSQKSFEGIRAQDVLPLLVERFHFELFLGFANVIDVFIDRGFGPNFDPDREWDREFIDRVHFRDVEGLLSGELKPTHMIAVMRTTPAPKGPRVWRHLTPEFCVRRP